jgi:hypothetical protein
MHSTRLSERHLFPLRRPPKQFKSSNFKAHRHDPALCDCIVCWRHDCPTIPRHIEVIELKRFFGVPFKVWIQAAVRNQWEALDAYNRMGWALSTRVTYGDLLLMYRCYPQCSVTDLFLVTDSRLRPGKPGWKAGGEANFGRIQLLCRLDSPVFLSDMRNHKVLRTAPFIRSNMQGRGGLLVSEYWPYLYGCSMNATRTIGACWRNLRLRNSQPSLQRAFQTFG